VSERGGEKRGERKTNPTFSNIFRFEFDLETMRKIKVNDHISFPQELNMFPFTKEGLGLGGLGGLGEGEEGGGGGEQSEETAPAGENLYELKGVLIHTGTSDSGHYYSLIKERENEGNWFEFNDSTVSDFDIKDMDEQCFGGFKTTSQWDYMSSKYVMKSVPKQYSAYLLVYDKKKVAEENNTMSDGDKKEEEIVEVEVEADMYNRIWRENEIFLKDKLLLAGNFFDWLYKVCMSYPDDISVAVMDIEGALVIEDMVDAQQEKTAAPRKLLQIVTVYVFEYLIRWKSKEKLVYYLRWLTHHFEGNGDICRWFLKFVGDSDLFWLMQTVLKNPSQEWRIKFADFFAMIMKNVAVEEGLGEEGEAVNIYESTSLNASIITQLLRKLPTVSYACRRSEQFFSLFSKFAQAGKKEAAWLKRAGVMRHLADFYLQGIDKIVGPEAVERPTVDLMGSDSDSDDVENVKDVKDLEVKVKDELALWGEGEEEAKLQENHKKEMEKHNMRKIDWEKGGSGNILAAIAIMLDEGGTGGVGMGVRERGILKSDLWMNVVSKESKNEVNISKIYMHICRGDAALTERVLKSVEKIFKVSTNQHYAPGMQTCVDFCLVLGDDGGEEARVKR